MIKIEKNTPELLQYFAQDTGYVFLGWCLILCVITPAIYFWILYGEISGGALCILSPFVLLGLYLVIGVLAFRLQIDKGLGKITLSHVSLLSRKKDTYDIEKVKQIIFRKKIITYVRKKKGKRIRRRSGSEHHIYAQIQDAGSVLLLTTEKNPGLISYLWGTPVDAQVVAKQIADFLNVPFLKK